MGKRNAVKILDIVSFLNEVELVKIRFEEHWDYVDRFIVTEACETYAKKPKSYVFLDNINHFKPYMSKVEFFRFDMAKTFFTNITGLNQDLQKYSIFIKRPEYFTDYDYCVDLDLDEIIDRRSWPAIMECLKKGNITKGGVLLRHFRHYLDWEYDHKYLSILAVSKMEHLLDKTIKIRPMLAEKVGYHLSFMGGPEKVKYKLENFMHHKEIKPETYAKLDSHKKSPFRLYDREVWYGEPKILKDPKAEMPLSIQNYWDFFQTWTSTYDIR